MSMRQIQEGYDRIHRTWRYQDEAEKRAMVGRLRGFLGDRDLAEHLAADIAKLIDEIETEVRLEELRGAQVDGDHPAAGV